MANLVIDDKILANTSVVRQNFVAEGASAKAARGESQKPAVRSDSADVSRASKRFAQLDESVDSTGIASDQQIKQHVVALQREIAKNPNAAVGAFANLNPDGFAAAIAEPSNKT